MYFYDDPAIGPRAIVCSIIWSCGLRHLTNSHTMADEPTMKLPNIYNGFVGIYLQSTFHLYGCHLLCSASHIFDSLQECVSDPFRIFRKVCMHPPLFCAMCFRDDPRIDFFKIVAIVSNGVVFLPWCVTYPPELPLCYKRIYSNRPVLRKLHFSKLHQVRVPR